ncbi:DUF885 family protein [Sphingomonas sp. ID1715]|uniref:DUF885 domain-containing protein n=1 Tax=Sphingomonas sp. ID1715 TaxID=1656898 RepID=UPI0014884F70|nr:DUF885 family protein [Sphingomonas sp. ID1715]NNM77885.1 DUF885 family protein [Sphingomonas sp. ID1715]
MDRRAFLLSSGAVAAAAAVPPALAKTSPGAADARLHALLERFFYDRLNDSPEQATNLGLDTGARAALRGKLSDNSPAGQARRRARTHAEKKALAAIDRNELSAGAQIDYDVVQYQLDRAIAGERFSYGETGGQYTPYVLNQMSGAYREVPDFLEGQHPVNSTSDAEAYLARLSAMPVAIAQDMERQRADAAKGVIAPDYVLDRSLGLLAEMRDKPAAQTLLVESLREKLAAKKLPDSFAVRAEQIVTNDVFPALDRQRVLVQELRGKASHDAGVWRLPDGDAFYAAAAEAAITAPFTGEEIHRIGLEQVAEISGRIDAILKSQGMSQGSVGERLVALNKRPDQVFPNTDEGKLALVATLNAQIAAMTKRLLEAFATVPKGEVVARRVPPAIQSGAPGGYYESAPLDRSRPASYFINLRDTFDRPKFGLATLSYHEAVPGHHLQGSLALENTGIPLIRRRSYFSGYGEGWALYAEQLADEMGVYEDDPLGRVGYLQSLLFRATRLVVDSGLHVKRWSREQATDYFMATTGIARNRSQNEIDRYTVWPGQACSYKLGHTVWVRLRDEAKQRQGSRFDLKAFHDVLTVGAMPLSVLERVVKARYV